jgi:AcrR family transcriptional regulator
VASRSSQGGADGRAELGPLPGGHHGLSRDQVSESQRERLLAAIAHEVADRGYRATTITGIVKLASVSTRDFYEHFESKEACFIAAFEAVLGHLEELIGEVVAERAGEWPDQVIAALATSLDFFSSQPDLARLCLLEPFTATPTIAIRFREAVLSCVPYLALGRTEHPDGESLPASTEDSLIGGVISLVSRSILDQEAKSLPSLLPDLVEFVLSPYLGTEQAKKLAVAGKLPT